MIRIFVMRIENLAIYIREFCKRLPILLIFLDPIINLITINFEVSCRGEQTVCKSKPERPPSVRIVVISLFSDFNRILEGQSEVDMCFP